MPTDPHQMEAGSTLSDTYRIIDVMGQGGMGTVYAAEHLRLSGKRVAIKVLRYGSALSDAELMGRFRREAEICASLSHPHVVDVTDWNEVEGFPYFVMEYLAGESLEERMERTPALTRSEVNAVLRQIASALSEAHKNNVVHRDLKPGNVFLVDAPDTFIKVLDFGISKLVGNDTLETSAGRVFGSPAYLSPEQAHALNEKIDGRADQFALSVMAYEMYAGERPFRGATMLEQLSAVVNADPIPLHQRVPDIPQHTAAAVSRGLAKDPDERFADIEAFARALLDPESPEGRQATEDFHRRESKQTLVRRPATEVKADVQPEVDLAKEAPSRHLPGGVWAAVFVGAILVGLSFQYAFRRAGEPKGKPPAVEAAAPEPQVAVENAGRTVDIDDAPSEEVAPSSSKQAPAKKPDKTTAVRQRENLANLPTEIATKLRRATRLLEEGEYAEADRAARQSLLQRDTVIAREIILLSHCSRRDLGNAKAALRALPPGARGAARRKCSKRGLDL